MFKGLQSTFTSLPHLVLFNSDLNDSVCLNGSFYYHVISWQWTFKNVKCKKFAQIPSNIVLQIKILVSFQELPHPRLPLAKDGQSCAMCFRVAFPRTHSASSPWLCTTYWWGSLASNVKFISNASGPSGRPPRGFQLLDPLPSDKGWSWGSSAATLGQENALSENTHYLFQIKEEKSTSR